MTSITPAALRGTADNLAPYPAAVLRDAADEIERLAAVNADLLAALKEIAKQPHPGFTYTTDVEWARYFKNLAADYRRLAALAVAKAEPPESNQGKGA